MSKARYANYARQVQRESGDWLGGIRHVGSMIITQALVRNVGTCRSDAKGAARSRGTASA